MQLAEYVTRGLAFLAITVVSVLFGACSPPERDEIRLAGAADLYYLSVVLNDEYAANAGIKAVTMSVSADAINHLRNNKVDAVLMGREPTPEELTGLKDYVVAYDAVCIILDENSYKGGTAYGAGRPMRKNTGLRELSSDNLTKLLSPGWLWEGGYYSANPFLDTGSFLWNYDNIAWILEPRSVQSAFVFPPGKFDTQSVVYRNLGLDEEGLLSGRTSWTSPQFSREEQVLSYEYRGSMYGQASGVQDFPFKLAFSSRRAMTVAPKHIPVRVIPIDGIDPLVDAQAVYDGTYLFSRKIHFLVAEKGPAEAVKLAEFLTTAEGQKMISGAGYLPMIGG